MAASQASTPSARDRVDDAPVDLAIDQQLARLPVDEQRDRHAPGALAAEHPVGPLLDHRAEAVAAFLGHEASVGDGLHRELAERWALIASQRRMVERRRLRCSQRCSARVSSADCRCASGLSMAMNHCGVQR